MCPPRPHPQIPKRTSRHLGDGPPLRGLYVDLAMACPSLVHRGTLADHLALDLESGGIELWALRDKVDPTPPSASLPYNTLLGPMMTCVWATAKGSTVEAF